MSSNFERKFPHKFGNFCKFLCNYGHLAVIAYGTGCNFCFPLCYRYLKQSIASIPKSFLKGSTLVSFSFIFGLFQTNNTFFTTNQRENISIQYTAQGFEPTTS